MTQTVAATQHALDLAKIAARAAADKLATTITGLDVSGQMPLTDIFVIVSADNERQVQAVSEAIEDTLREEAGVKTLRREGHGPGRWVLLDFGDIVVHAQHDDELDFYDLERLWRDCPHLDLGVVGSQQTAGEQ